jgi:hypothetical protein
MEAALSERNGGDPANCSLNGHPTGIRGPWPARFSPDRVYGGVTASTEMLAAKRHAGVYTPVIAYKMIIANQQMAYAA